MQLFTYGIYGGTGERPPPPFIYSDLRGGARRDISLYKQCFLSGRDGLAFPTFWSGALDGCCPGDTATGERLRVTVPGPNRCMEALGKGRLDGRGRERGGLEAMGKGRFDGRRRGGHWREVVKWLQRSEPAKRGGGGKGPV